MKADHDLCLKACQSGNATEEECSRLSYAAGMWAAGETSHIPQVALELAKVVLLRRPEPSQDLPVPEYSVQPVKPYLPKWEQVDLRVTILSGEHTGRMFHVIKQPNGYQRGHSLYVTLDQAIATVE